MWLSSKLIFNPSLTGTPATSVTCAGMQPVCSHDSQPLIPLCYSQSTLLIPEKYHDYYQSQCLLHGSRRAYFAFIVTNYLPHVRLFEGRLNQSRTHKWKTDYQAEGQCLLRRNFVPIPEDWECFRHIASAFGVSMCYFFVFLVELEMNDFFLKNNPNIVIDWNSEPIYQKIEFLAPKVSKLLRIINRKSKMLKRYSHSQ